MDSPIFPLRAPLSRSAAPVRPFSAPWLIAGATVQTMGPSLPWFASSLASVKRLVPVPGGAVHMHVNVRPGPTRAPAVLLVHGVGGSSDSTYVRRTATAFLEAGYHVARLDLRGAGESYTDAPSLYHAGLTDDLDRAAATLAGETGVESVSVVGVSLGGNLSLNLAARWGDAPPRHVRAVATISPAVDLAATSTWLERRRTFFYRNNVLRKLVAGARAFYRTHPDEAASARLAKLTPLSTLRQYDSAVIVPMHGFGDVENYYATASSGPHLGAVRVPTLFSFAEDDPMIPFSTVRPALANASSRIEVALSKGGGHVGGFESLSREGFVKTWYVRQVLAFLAKHL